MLKQIILNKINKIKKDKPVFPFIEEPTDERRLENLDQHIQNLYVNKRASIDELSYRATVRQKETIESDYYQNIQNCERERKMLFDRMSIKSPKEVWYRSSWFIAILCAIIGVLGTIFGAFLSVKK